MGRKLIETALPLDAINAASMREKSIRHGHPSTLHLWWARRPLAAARAVLWASLVDDPSAHPEDFSTEEDQARERERLFHILEELVVWENSTNEAVLGKAKIEIIESMGPDPIEFLDPFAGGGSIPLEAQRLGLIAHAQDLNPVPVLINKAMIELPAKFANEAPVNPEARQELSGTESYAGAAGLSKDIEYYGQWMKEEAYQRIGHLYPLAKLPDGSEAPVIARLWARTITCPNPACSCEVPLTNSFDVSKKKGKEMHTVVEYDAGGSPVFHVEAGPSPVPGTVNRQGGLCPRCGATIKFPWLRTWAREHGFGTRLMAKVAEGPHGRYYLDADPAEQATLDNEVVHDTVVSSVSLPRNTRDFKTPIYGIDTFDKLYTSRQLTMLTTFSDLVSDAQHKAAEDAQKAGMTEPAEYGKAIATYLAFVVDKMADYHSSVCGWNTVGEKIRNVFTRQAIPMVWDYAETNPFSNSSGCWSNMLDWVVKSVVQLPVLPSGIATQHDADAPNDLRNVMISSDPPYYDNIGYADLSDFFYIWLRRALRDVYPDLFRRMVTPKNEELIAAPYRHEGSKEKAKEFFEAGMLKACQQMNLEARSDIPVTIYYAYKQQDQKTSTDGTSSSGWETMLSAIIQAGFQITGTWPIRTERAGRTNSQDANALASSVVLVCRKRPEDAGVLSRPAFVKQLRTEMRPALRALQLSNIAPVDMAQSAIGPGMAVFSRYSQVMEPDGTPTTIRDALQAINEELDRYLSEQAQNLDSEARLCVDIYTQYGFEPMPFGQADVLARAKNTSVANLEHRHLVEAEKGKVRLTPRNELPEELEATDSIWLLAQALARALDRGGLQETARIVAGPSGPKAGDAKDLAYRLYTIAEQKGWQAEARLYNNLVTSWLEILEQAAKYGSVQSSMLDAD